jgi:TRAP transporter TAXI family solute receptor
MMPTGDRWTSRFVGKRAHPMLLATVFSASISMSCVAPAVVADRARFTLATGGPGGVDLPVGNAICRMFNLAQEALTKPCLAVISDGSVGNVHRVRTGERALGLAQSDVAYAAYRGRGVFEAAGPDAGLRTLIVLHSEALAVIVRADSGLRRFEDLRGRRISVGKTDVSYAATRDDLLASHGWTISDFEGSLELGLAEQNHALCGGTVDAIMFQAAQPNGFIQEATIGCPARLLRLDGPAIDRLLAAHPYYAASVIPGGVYVGNPEDIPTFGTRALLVTSVRQPEDFAYAVVKAVFQNFADFRRLHPALFTLRIGDMVPEGTVVPLHPGATKYYREAGLAR